MSADRNADLRALLDQYAKAGPEDTDAVLAEILKERFGAEGIQLTDELRRRMLRRMAEKGAAKGPVSGKSNKPQWFRFIWVSGLACAIVAIALWAFSGTRKSKPLAIVAPRPKLNLAQPSKPKAPTVSHPLPRLVASLTDEGNQVGVEPSGILMGLDSLQPTDRERAKRAILQGLVSTPNLVRLSGQSSLTMGIGEKPSTFTVIGPARTRVASTRPLFRWHRVKGAKGFKVTVVDDSKQEEVWHSPPVPSTSWRPDARHVLARGKTYRWYVVAETPGGEVQAPALTDVVAKFQVLDRRSISALRQALARAGKSHLAAGLTYANFGLIDDSRKEFEALARENPNSKQVRRLLRRMEALAYRPSPTKTNPDQ